MDPDQENLETADQRSDAAKRSLRDRIHEIEHRVNEAKDTFDIPSKISAHPRLAVGIAAGVGALLGYLGGGTRGSVADDEKRGLAGAIVAALGAIAIQAIKEYALREGADLAQKWWADRVDRDTSVDVH